MKKKVTTTHTVPVIHHVNATLCIFKQAIDFIEGYSKFDVIWKSTVHKGSVMITWLFSEGLSRNLKDHMECKITAIKLLRLKLTDVYFLVLITWYQDLFKRSLSDSQLRHGTFRTSLRIGY